MNKKKIMILGASQLQVPAIIKAKEMGLYVIVLDMNKNAVGVKYADEFCEISTIDTESIVNKAIELNIDGIMTLATDMPMRSVAAVGERLGLTTVSYEAAIKATDKARMREQLLSCEVPIPFFSTVRSYEDFEKVVNSFQGDLIIKPADSSGSRGVHLLEDRNDLKAVYEYSRVFSKTGEIVVEEFMQGPEVSVETITINGITHIIAITDKLTTGAPNFVEMGHSIPSQLSDNVKKDIESVAKAAIMALGIDNSASHTEIIVTDQGPKIVELGARLGGDNITTSLVPLATGVDMVGACIELAIGNIPNIERRFNKGAAIRYFNSSEGVLLGVDGIEVVTKKLGVKEIVISRSIGDKVYKINSSIERIGYIIGQGTSSKMAIETCNQAIDEIKICIK